MDIKKLLTEIETYIDKTSVSSLLQEIADICMEKSEHIGHTWQDEPLALQWQKRAEILHEAIDALIPLEKSCKEYTALQPPE